MWEKEEERVDGKMQHCKIVQYAVWDVEQFHER